jgi:hypothetical protein
MEDEEQCHQYTNLLWKGQCFLLDTGCRFRTACYFENMYGIPGNHKPQQTKQVQQKHMLSLGCPHFVKESWLHKTM